MDEVSTSVSEPVSPQAEPQPVKRKVGRPRKMLAPDQPLLREMDPDQMREYTAERVRRFRLGEAAKKDIAAQEPESDVEVPKKDALVILADRGVANAHVREICWELAQTVSKMQKVPLNWYLFRHGVQNLQSALKDASFEPFHVPDEWKPGERIRQRDLYALWDFSISWRTQPDGRQISFKEFGELRRLCVTDLFRFGKEILGKDFEEEPHGRWARDVFVRKNPDLFPEKLTRETLREAFAAQSKVHTRCLIASRNSFKSTIDVVDILQWVLLTGGDIRILMVSATKPLAAGFLSSFQDYLTVKNSDYPTLFQQLWPEYAMSHEDRYVKGGYVSLMRQLDWIQPTIQNSSMQSEGLAGERADIIIFEDAADSENSGNVERRIKTLETFDLVRELLDPSPYSYTTLIGTPYASSTGPEDPGDIYEVTIQRNEGSPDFIHLIQPAWKVNPGVFTVNERGQEVPKTAWDEALKPDEVELLFPKWLTFDVLMKKLKDCLKKDRRAKNFRQQELCEHVNEGENEIIKLQFVRDVLRSHIIPLQGIPEGETYIFGDTSFSTSPRADLSALAVLRVCVYPPNDFRRICVLDLVSGRMRGSEFGYELVKLTERWHPIMCGIEKPPSSDLLADAIALQSRKYGIPVPLHWLDVDNSKNAKFLRLKALEAAIASGRILFASAPYIDSLFDQMERLDGSTSVLHRKNDLADSLGLGVIKLRHILAPTAAECQKDFEMWEQQRARDAEYRMHFEGPGSQERHDSRPYEVLPNGMRRYLNTPVAPFAESTPPPPPRGFGHIFTQKVSPWGSATVISRR